MLVTSRESMISSCLFGFLDFDDVGGLLLPSLCRASRSRRCRSRLLRSSSGFITLLLIDESELRLMRVRFLCCSGDGGSAKMSSSFPRGLAPVRGRWLLSSCECEGWWPEGSYLVRGGRFSDLRGMVSARGGRVLYGGGTPCGAWPFVDAEPLSVRLS